MAAIFDFNGSGRLGRVKFILRGRSTVKNKERGGGRGVEITSTSRSPYAKSLTPLKKEPSVTKKFIVP